MKKRITISIDDDKVQALDDLASTLGLSRSALFNFLVSTATGGANAVATAVAETYAGSVDGVQDSASAHIAAGDV